MGDLLLEKLWVELERVPLPLLSLPPSVHSTALCSSRPHCLESEGAKGGNREGGGGIQKCENV